MVIDSSSLVAVVLGEADAESHLRAMIAADVKVMSAATWVEASIVIEARQGPDASRDLQLLLDHLGVEVVAFDDEQAARAVAAWRRFGKGRHPASLNLGDCFSYALAQSFDESLLFKGMDFTQTDIRAALA